MSKKKTIVLAAGGTGGHLFPALATFETLENSGHNIHLVIDKRCQKFLPNDESAHKYKNTTIHVIDLYLNYDGIFNKVRSIFRLIKAILQAFWLMRKINPDIIVGFGGYPSFPSLLAARIMSVSMILQEQNCYLGKVNKFFSSYAKYIATSYAKIKNLDARYQNKIIVIGNIVRDKIAKLAKKQDFTSEVMHIFIFGGSQSAKIFSHIIPDAVAVLIEKHKDIKINITQQVGKDELQRLEETYSKLLVEHNLAEFFFNMDEIYQNTDLVIARAGASTIYELSTIGLPAIFIPLPSAADNHQYHNARALEDNRASWLFEQKSLSPEKLAGKIYELYENRTLLKEASNNLLKNGSRGNQQLADTILKIIT